MKPPVALFGTGLLGSATAERLLHQKYPLIVFNRSPEKTETLRRKGAQVANTPQEAMAKAHRIIFMLTNAAAIVEILDDIPPDALRGRTVIQMGTISPQESRDLAERIHVSGGAYLEAPVLGSRPEARSGKLLIMVGAEEEQFERNLELFSDLGKSVTRFGGVGTAATVKLALNQLIATMTAAFSMSLAYIRKNDVAVDDFMRILRQSPLFASTFDKKLPRMEKNDFSNPNFPLRHLRKDLRLVMREMNRCGINAFPLDGVDRLIAEALNMGLGTKDYAAMYNAVHPTKD